MWQIVQHKLHMLMLMTVLVTIYVLIPPIQLAMGLTILLLMGSIKDVSRCARITPPFNYLGIRRSVSRYALMVPGVILLLSYACLIVILLLGILLRIILQVRTYVFKIVLILIGSEITPHGRVWLPVLPLNLDKPTENVSHSATMVVLASRSTTGNASTSAHKDGGASRMLMSVSMPPHLAKQPTTDMLIITPGHVFLPPVVL